LDGLLTGIEEPLFIHSADAHHATPLDPPQALVRA
jgi:hypothetical protein